MVVVVIIGILATLVSLSVGNRALDDRMELEANRLNRILQLASEEAETKGIEIGFRYTEDKFQLLALDKDGRWADYTESGPLRSREVPAPFYLELFIEGRAVPPAQDSQDREKKIEPQAILLSSGEVTAFTLNLRARGYKPFFKLNADALGKFVLNRKEAAP